MGDVVEFEFDSTVEPAGPIFNKAVVVVLTGNLEMMLLAESNIMMVVVWLKTSSICR